MTTTLKARVDALKSWHPKLPGYMNYNEEVVAVINEQQALLREAMEALKYYEHLEPEGFKARAVLPKLKAALEG